MRIQLKIALLFTVVTAITMLFITIFIYYFASRNAFQDFQKRLEVRANLAARAFKSSPESGNLRLDAFTSDLLERLPAQKEYVIKLANQQAINVPGEIEVPSDFFSTAISTGYASYQKNQKYYAAIYDKGQGNNLVMVSAVNTYGQHYLDNLKRIKIFGLIIKIILVFTIGFYFSKRMIEPVRNIIREAREISVLSLHRRLPVIRAKDELGELTNTFNNMLDRLETAFESQNNFVSNASHELSTPLTTIIAESELALIKERTPEEYRACLEVILSQAERLKQITRSLLQLAQSGFDGSKQEMKPMRVDELLLEVKETIDELYPENKVYFDFSLMPDNHELLQISGNRPLLLLAFSNIFMNACKYSNNHPVKVAAGSTIHKVVVVVQDEGIGIPKQELPYVFDPFFRASNTRSFKGYGIGLPLTRNIIRLHKGEIIVSSEQNKGTVIQVTLPIYEGS